MKSNCQNNNILFSIYKNNIFIKAEGHITANLCFSLREYLYREIPNMDPTFDVFVDLNNTDYMDSTFLGLLIGIEKRLYNNFKKHLHIINLCKLAIDLFDNMELENFFKIEKKEIPKEVIFKKFNESIEID
ncbi:MAG: STAS domain-containing protein, partial [Spirochaetes bacterium]|nr:STAS domain-containing protein [Spirochaetota bacterium]